MNRFPREAVLETVDHDSGGRRHRTRQRVTVLEQFRGMVKICADRPLSIPTIRRRLKPGETINVAKRTVHYVDQEPEA